VLAYNFFLRRLKVIHADLDELGADLISLARRSGFRVARLRTVPGAAGATTALAGQAA